MTQDHGVLNRQLDSISEIARERKRQVEVEGWTPEHDDQHDNGEMLTAAVCYYIHATQPEMSTLTPPVGWPWDAQWWKPKGARRDLVRAGALCIAERARLERAGRDFGHVTDKYSRICAALWKMDDAANAA